MEKARQSGDPAPRSGAINSKKPHAANVYDFYSRKKKLAEDAIRIKQIKEIKNEYDLIMAHLLKRTSLEGQEFKYFNVSAIKTGN